MKKIKRILSLLVCAAMIIGMMPVMALAEGKEPPTPSYSYDSWGEYLKIDFGYANYEYVGNITTVRVDDVNFDKAASYETDENKYTLYENDGYIRLIADRFKSDGKFKVELSSSGYNELVINLVRSDSKWSGEVVTNGSGDSGDDTAKKPAPEMEGSYASEMGQGYYKFLIKNDNSFISGITEIYVNDVKWSTSSTQTYISGNQYYINIDSNTIVFAESIFGSGDVLKANDTVKIVNPEYEDVILTVTATGSDFDVTQDNGTGGEDEPGPIPVSGISLDESTVELKVGVTATLTATVEPDNADNKDVTWESSDEEVATVENGKVTAVKAGTATITVKSADDEGIFATCAVSVTDDEQSGDVKKSPEVNGQDIEIGGEFFKDSYYAINILDNNEYINNITKIEVNDLVWDSDQLSYLYGKDYYIDKDNNRIVFGKQFGSPLLADGDIIKIYSTGYEQLELKVVIGTEGFTVGMPDEVEEYVLHVRLDGYFEAAVLGQKGYDAITGSSTSVSENKNSNAVVMAALVKEGTEPKDDDWKALDMENTDIDIDANHEKTYINMYNTETNTNNSGMAGKYSVYDGSVTLAGTPSEAGEYKISVTVTDKQGRTATSNELTFRIYDLDETTLSEQIVKQELYRDMGGGKVSFEMEPWVITNFGGNNETVTVPENIKLWYGSHTTGTYGELGYAIPWTDPLNPTQTLVIPEGCELTFVNMDILSSVKIVVHGKVNFIDSSIEGLIEVEDRGTFSMNYNNGQIVSGSSINGQLILKDGATLENAAINSFTNYIANGDYERINSEPVVVVDGDVTLKGDVYIKGEEAADGKGQQGLLIKDGTLTLEDGANLAAYGGGSTFLTTEGGDAIILNNGNIVGNGTVVAMGGDGGWLSDSGSGGNAVTGNGTIATTNVYLQGGDSVISQGSAPGAALGEGVELSGKTNRQLIDGKNTESYDKKENYWDILTPPSFDVYKKEIEENGDPNAEDPIISVQVKKIGLNKDEIDLEKGDKFTLIAEVSPANASNKTIYWSSSDTSVAVVDTNGRVTAVGKGTAVITAVAVGGKAKAECKVTVTGSSYGGGSSYSLEEVKGGSVTERPVIGSNDEENLVFIDVPESHRYYDAIMAVYENGWMAGIGGNVFAPEGTLTRGMAAQILWNMAGKPDIDSTAPFRDVTSDAWYAKAISWAYEQGIILGYGNSAFGPNDFVTEEQFEIMITKYNGGIPAAYTGVSPYATRGWVAGRIAE